MKRRHAEYCAQCNPFFKFCVYFEQRKKIWKNTRGFLLSSGERETSLDKSIFFNAMSKIHNSYD